MNFSPSFITFTETPSTKTLSITELSLFLKVKGFKKKVSPLTGITGNLIHWMLTAQWADHMARRGEMPYFWQGYHENGGSEYDNMVKPFFDKRGY